MRKHTQHRTDTYARVRHGDSKRGKKARQRASERREQRAIKYRMQGRTS